MFFKLGIWFLKMSGGEGGGWILGGGFYRWFGVLEEVSDVGERVWLVVYD